MVKCRYGSSAVFHELEVENAGFSVGERYWWFSWGVVSHNKAWLMCRGGGGRVVGYHM